MIKKSDINRDNGQGFDPGIECVEITLTVVGQRDPSVVRGRTTKFSNNGYGNVMQTIEDKMRAYTHGESLRAQQNVRDLSNFAQVDVAASGNAVNIVNGWETVRYMVHAIFRAAVSSQVTEWIVAQGFTEHYDILTLRGATQVLFDDNAIVEINKMSYFKQVNNGLITPTGSYNVVMDRWNDGQGLFITQPNTIFASVALNNSALGRSRNGITRDGRVIVGEDVNTINNANAVGENFANSLLNTAIDSSVEVVGSASNGNIASIAASYTAPASIHTNRLTEAIIAFYFNDVERSVNPHNFTFAFLKHVTPDFDTRIFVNGDPKLKEDGYYVLDAGGAEQLSVDSSALEIKLSSMISEAVGSIMVENDMKSISISILGDRSNAAAPVSAKLNGLIEHIIMGTGAQNEMASAEKAKNEITHHVAKIMNRFSRYVIKVEVFGMVACAITMRIELDAPICSTWSLFADSLVSNGISTEGQFRESVDHTDALMGKISRDIVFFRDKYGHPPTGIITDPHQQFAPSIPPQGYNPPSSPASSGSIIMGSGTGVNAKTSIVF